MSTILERMRQSAESGAIDPSLVVEAIERIAELQSRADRLEELLIILVRTGWPWNEEGEPTEILKQAKEGFGPAMKEARELLNLDRSRLTRTEPRT